VHIIFEKEDLSIFGTSVEKFKVDYLTRMTVTLHEDLYIFIISCSILLAINFSGKVCNENQNRHFMFNNFLKIVPL